ncbi:4Fe-4S binding protein [Cysteiniphilum halobium]|uniref:4Fe-4S binding protein n=1 Tax=Cysteiniphilum halobium TaxID=2219059 RepID=UPI003F84A2FD
MKPNDIITSAREVKDSRRLLKIEQFFHRNRGKVKYIQILMFAFFLFLVIVPIYSPNPKAEDTILTSIVLLSQFLFWGVWYGACLFSVILFGRLWCGVLCPLGALSEWVGHLGFKKVIPNWIQWDGWLIIMFVIITIMGQTLDVRDDPAGLARLFLYIFILAIIVGLFFGKNSSRPWCRYFCPIGKILGVVSRIGAIDFRPNRGQLKLAKDKKYYVDGRLCPTNYNLPYKVSTNNCITCGACAYGKKKSGLGIYWRQPGSEANNILKHHPNWYEVLFILLSPGISAGGFLWLILHQYQQLRNVVGDWFLDKNYLWIFNHAPVWISSQRWNQHYNWLDVGMITFYMMSYAIVVALISSILIGVTAFLLRTKSNHFKTNFLVLTYQYIPVAILSIVIGLCGKFFQVMANDFNMSAELIISIKSILLGLSILWTVYLTGRVIKKIKQKSLFLKWLGFSVLLINMSIIIVMWWPAIAGHKYMSQVEKIRKHIVIPG